MAAVLCVISLIQIPIPATGVPVTLQIFAVALSGYVLGAAFGGLPVLIYVSVGLVGVPVFSGYMGGFSVLFGPTGGFLLGFFLLALLSGIGKPKKPVPAILFGIAGLVLCHMLGIVHYMLVTDCALFAACLTVSLPYIIKDIALVVGAYFLSLTVKRGNK